MVAQWAEKDTQKSAQSRHKAVHFAFQEMRNLRRLAAAEIPCPQATKQHDVIMPGTSQFR